MKRSTLIWFGHIEVIKNEKFVKKVYLGSVEGPNRRGRPLGRWEDRVKEDVNGTFEIYNPEGGGNEWRKEQKKKRIEEKGKAGKLKSR